MVIPLLIALLILEITKPEMKDKSRGNIREKYGIKEN
jgi:hypothetical protein